MAYSRLQRLSSTCDDARLLGTWVPRYTFRLVKRGGQNKPGGMTKYCMRISEITPPPTPEQQRIKALKANKDRATQALKNERDRQKRAKANRTLASLSLQSQAKL